MLLNIEDFELEIVEDKFVCLDNGITSRFCEWKYLDPELQEKFRIISKNLSGIMDSFIDSHEKTIFDSIAEEYAHPSGCVRE